MTITKAELLSDIESTISTATTNLNSVLNTGSISTEADKNKALKNSLKYTSKFVKKDKERELYHEFLEFYDILWGETKNAAETEMDNEKELEMEYKWHYVIPNPLTQFQFQLRRRVKMNGPETETNPSLAQGS